MKRFVFVLVVITVILVTSLVGVGVSLSEESRVSDETGVSLSPKPTFIPTLTFIPTITFIPLPTMLSLYVNIPDPNLDLALHQEVGKPMSQKILYIELAGLTGDLYLGGKGISNAEGVQYCTNISGLIMDGNNLTTLPTMNYMNGLAYVSMSDNDFSMFPPSLATAPNLQSINLSDNPISSVGAIIGTMGTLQSLWLEDCALNSFPGNVANVTSLRRLNLNNNDIGTIPAAIANLTNLTHLHMNSNGISELPSALYSMSNLKTLEVSDNGIDSISTSISGMTSLEYLMINDNDLQSLPSELFAIGSFKAIIAIRNSLYSLPSNIGSSNIEQITVRENRITHLPSNIGDAANLYLVDVMVNRLRELPSSFDDKSYDFINLEFNFLDVTPGSDARNIIDNTTTFTLYYERQLKPIDEVIAVPTDVSVALSWDAGMDGAQGGASWTVEKYSIYLSNSYTKIGETLPTEFMFEHTGLTPETTYLYHVGVDYHVVVPSHSIDTMIRAYTDAEPTTLAEGAMTSPTESAQATEAPAEEEMTPEQLAEQEAAQAAAAAAEAAALGEEIGLDNGEKPGLPIWAIIVICVLGTAVVGTGAGLVIMKVKGGKKGGAKRA
ncbi:MAG: leucine-rich repeat domain-containing protein [Clostridia bacterium]|nr:leucine-rich repeat domain-containing protein [Clostridia bacterium]MBT7122788.1 leucine-rich repeat domain-containing protein [Clostridia bacterium]